MKVLVSTTSVLLCCAASLLAQDRPSLGPGLQPFVSVDAPLVALTHVGLMDGTGAPFRSDQTIVIEGNQIQAVGAYADVEIPECGSERSSTQPHRRLMMRRRYWMNTCIKHWE